ncbi:shikimate kinase [Pseudoflavonifractor phocaeensis]|uniref:shikimate kinase n=1 Tax=Pseudoflavonifractor phocaeensis TaxID=1870988 RepID=UPI00313AE04C
MRNVSLIGMPGSGKSTVGVLLAKELGFSFVDTDLLIQRQEGALLQSVLDRLGTERFLDTEAEVIAALDCQRTVIAPGGSAVLRDLGARRLKELGPVLYLKLPCAALERRLGDLASRGVTLAPGQTLQDLYDYRAPYYEKYADLVIDADQPRLEDTVALALAALRQL